MTTLVAEDWQSVAFATRPADRDRAEAGVRAAYAAAGLPAPERFLWVPSPAAGAIAAALIGGADGALAKLGAAATIREQLGGLDAGSSVRDAVRTRPWEAARAAAYAELGPQEWSRAWARTGARLWDPVNSLVTRIRRGIGELGGEESETLLRAATLDAVLGQHDAPWLMLFDTLTPTRVAEDTNPTHTSQIPDSTGFPQGSGGAGLAGLAEVARSAGWWWPYERIVIISERPAELHRDEPGRLHRGDGPAMGSTDGFALHAWRGMPTPSDFITTLSGLTTAQIGAEDNAELRWVMLEHYGYDRYLADVGAEPLHRDETGVLWRIDLRGNEPIVMVEVVNSTPEPDGTHRTYYLRVPPTTRTARQGVAWTFGIEENDYHPAKQT